VVLGFLNLVSDGGCPRRAVWYCLIGNVLGLAYAIAVVSVLAEPQAFVGVVLLLVLFSTTARRLVATRNAKVEATRY
jgi:hypothetical protein